MEVVRASNTDVGAAEKFTGRVFIDTVAVASETFRTSAAIVHFAPRARTAWHSHPLGQAMYLLEGVGRCQTRGGPLIEVRPGDRLVFEAGEEHWHGAAPNRLAAFVAVQLVDDRGVQSTFGEPVADFDYDATPEDAA